MKNLAFILLTGTAILLAGCGTMNKTADQPTIPQKNIRKSIAAPFLRGSVKLDGKLDEKIWQKACCFDDFMMHRKFTPALSRTEVRMFHDEKYLYIGIKCHDKKKDQRPADGNNDLWKNDCIELFLGNMDPEPNIHQFCWGSGTARYAASSHWDSKTARFDDYWTTETRIELSFLKPNNATLLMHLARLHGPTRKYMIWNDVGDDFQNMPRYAELILGSYDLAAQVKYRYYSDKKLTRAEYEKLNSERFVPWTTLVHGPWLYAASETEMNIGWYNEGRTGAYLQYRKKGDKKFREVHSHDHDNIIEKDRRTHKVQLKNLKKGTGYEYRIVNHSGNQKKFYPGEDSVYTFTTHGKKDLSMAIFADIHNEGYALLPLINNKKLMDQCDIIVNVGDMLSNSTGVLSIIRGYLDAQMSFARKKPILNFRGNHEYAGCAPGTFFDVFGTPDFKGYSLNRFGDVCIIGLDPWNSNQREWLKQAVKRPEFQTAKHRILFAHFPIMNSRPAYSRTISTVLNGIFSGENPTERLDLMISGHIHRGSFSAKNSGTAVHLNKEIPDRKIEKVPFDIFVHEGNRETFNNVMTIVETKGDSLVIKLIRMDGSVSKEIKVK